MPCMAFVHLRDAVAHRLHEAVDQRGRELGAGGRLDAPGGHEAGVERGGKTFFPLLALLGRLGLGQGARHAGVHGGDAALVALGVLLDQHLFADRLGGQVVLGVRRVGALAGLLHVGCLRCEGAR